ncbi:hypothetical protein GOBAR_AA19344 [Gossypium barbadense]|uniref:Uncharacterized protein n=1 Tax=Gossypium barbadense TaxID=3634 RepID=A0A2P5XDB3_GOSBA|nr:hypothetical protein GOBAR_AA19344 [Gossypium barbadense]
MPNLEEMLTKFISVPLGSLPSNTESNPRDQFNAISIQDEEWLVAKPRPEIVVSKGELILRVGEKTITFQDRNSSNTSKVEGGCINHSTSTDHVVTPSMQETVSKNTYEPCSNNNKGPIYKERRLQIEELDEWWTQKPRTPDKPKPSQDKLNTSPNQLKVGDKVLLDAADPCIATPEPNKETPLTTLSTFPYSTVKVIHPKFGTFKVNNTRIKPYVDKVDSRDEEYFQRPHSKAHGRALGRVKTGQDFVPTRDVINCHGRVTWPWAKLRKQHWRETRPCLETMVETDNVTQACNTPLPSTRGRHCQNKHRRGPMYTGVGEANEVRHGRVHPHAQRTRACANCQTCPNSKFAKHTGKN